MGEEILSIIPAKAGIHATNHWPLSNDLRIAGALTSDYVESLDFVGPNPLPCVGEGILSVIPTKAGIHATNDWLLSNALRIAGTLTSDYVESLDFVGPNPPPCAGEGTFLRFVADS